MNEFQKKLREVYKKDKPETFLGRRPASLEDLVDTPTPRQIQQAIRPSTDNFHNLVDVYLPTEKDIEEKGD